MTRFAAIWTNEATTLRILCKQKVHLDRGLLVQNTEEE